MEKKAIFTWSGGKDSALALFELKKTGDYKIEAMLTTVTKEYGRVSMHGYPTELLEQQAETMDIKLEIMTIPKDCSNDDYDNIMRSVLEKYMKQGINEIIFGDIFIEDVRKYRENNLAKIGMKGVFPLWKKDTKMMAKQFIELGFKAVVTCIDTKVLGKSFVGREFNNEFLVELPESVDPCGENGEFHTFVYNGPFFKNQISFKRGEIVLREDRFYYCDLISISI
jgi:uncharacterized protein (TIGR00290 family)